MKIERLNFNNKDGQKLSARLYLPLEEPPRFYAIFAHCFTCSKNFKAVSNISNTLSRLGVAVLSFDFTGLGNSEGDFENTGFSSNVEDLMAAAEFLEKNYEQPKLMIGHSLGGSAVIFAAAELDYVEAVVTIGSPANPKHVKKLFESDIETIKKEGSAKVNIGGRSFRIKKDFVEDLESKNLPESISKMRKAFLFLHSPQDQIVDISNSAKLFQSAHHSKSFVSLDGADHLLSDEKESKYVGELISTWSKKYLPVDINENDTKGHQVKVRLFGEGYTSEIKTPFHHLLADEPKEVGGDNLGPTPYDLLMASLGTCTVMTLKMYAERKGWDLKQITVYLDHDKIHQEDSADFKKKGSKISRFTRSLEIKGDLDKEMKEKLLEIADKCPVHRTLHADIIIETKFK
ncbi:alpha/beta fold hydrolase [Aquiflexum sp.]|uniref:bifunctional alpha/beta hydrolase/OsmC family protein n=1 Tax=Aquiflexum sp. TaxID=1872584 RepID=UPI00359490A6